MLLHTVQMLQAELESQAPRSRKNLPRDKVSVIMPVSLNVFQPEIAGAVHHKMIRDVRRKNN